MYRPRKTIEWQGKLIANYVKKYKPLQGNNYAEQFAIPDFDNRYGEIFDDVINASTGDYSRRAIRNPRKKKPVEIPKIF